MLLVRKIDISTLDFSEDVCEGRYCLELDNVFISEDYLDHL